jgi:hypothetical protein
MLKAILLGSLLLVFAGTAAAHDEPVIGTLAGAGIGAAIAGPPGAAVGAVIGAVAGATVAHDNDHDPKHRHHHHSRYQERSHAHVAPVRYNGNGATAYCEPKEGYYRPTVVRVEERPVKVRTVSTTTKMKRVCRYEPVRVTKVIERRSTERVVVASR